MALGRRHIRESVNNGKNGSRYDYRATVKRAAKRVRRENDKRIARATDDR
jgi:hypothetical protein